MLLLALRALLVLSSVTLHRKSPEKNTKQIVELTHRAAKEIPSLAAFIVERHGKVDCEEYFHGATPNTEFDVKSVTKSVVSAIAGAAKQRGLLPSLDTPFLDVMPEYRSPNRRGPHIWFGEIGGDDFDDFKEDDSLRNILTLRHLLTMQPGFTYNDFGPTAGELCWASDPVRFMIDMPFEHPPGDTFCYCTGASIMFGAALSKIVGTDLKTFADTALFAPAGMAVNRWATDPEGRRLGGSELFCRAIDLLKLGEVYLNKGMANGRQVLPKDWIDESLMEHAALTHWDVSPNINGYGYYWWRRISHKHQMYFASGYGGQLICIVPDLNMVIVTICTLGDNNRGRSELKRLHSYIDRIIAASN
jgi:CubicO group peptidase (beta-lactamase class C family)